MKITANSLLKILKKIFGDIELKVDPAFFLATLVIVSFSFYIFHDKAIRNYFWLAIILLFLAIINFLFFKNQQLRILPQMTIIFVMSFAYILIYDYLFVNHNPIYGSIYAELTGKIIEIKRFEGSRNQGYSAILEDVKISKIIRNSSNNKKTTKKQITKYTTDKIKKDFINVKNNLEIDRKFVDQSNNYQFIDWQRDKNGYFYPNPPKKIKVIINDRIIEEKLAVNDIIKFKAFIENDYQKEFPDDFDFAIFNKLHKIGGIAIATSDFEILSKNQINDFTSLIANLRSKIAKRITDSILDNDNSAIALALLVGNKNNISDQNLEAIRNSGLAHLLSISGFHMALAGSIFFLATLFIISRNENLMLNYDVRKISGIFAIFACFFYLKISGDLVPAKRAFMTIFLGFCASLFFEKANLIRLLSIIALLIVAINPYQVTSVGFQLSFLAVLIIISLQKSLSNQKNLDQNLLSKSILYFRNIIIISLAIQIFTMPFLLYAFGKFSILSPIANLLAIPVASFITMPFGFLSFFLMPFGIEKIALYPMELSIELILAIVYFINNFNYSYLELTKISGFSLFIAFIAIILVISSENKIKYVGFVVFLIAIFNSFNNKKYDIAFDNEQKFFVIYNKNGLFFSKKIRPSKHRDKWLEYFDEDEFKYLDECNNCSMEIKNKKFLIITNRANIDELCQDKDFDLIVNLSKKYKLPDCFNEDKIINNDDFLNKGGHFIKIINDKIIIDSTY